MKEAKNELMQFVAGIIMLVVGLYIFSQKVIVFSGFFSFGGGRFSSGLIVVPLIIGIVWMFVSGANFASKVFTVLAVIIIIASVVMTTNIHFMTGYLYLFLYSAVPDLLEKCFLLAISQMTKAEKAEIRKLMMFHQA